MDSAEVERNGGGARNRRGSAPRGRTARGGIEEGEGCAENEIDRDK